MWTVKEITGPEGWDGVILKNDIGRAILGCERVCAKDLKALAAKHNQEIETLEAEVVRLKIGILQIADEVDDDTRATGLGSLLRELAEPPSSIR